MSEFSTADLLEMPVSDIANSIALNGAARYLDDIAADGTWRASDEQVLNPKGYFGALRRVGRSHEEFIESIKSNQ